MNDPSATATLYPNTGAGLDAIVRAVVEGGTVWWITDELMPGQVTRFFAFLAFKNYGDLAGVVLDDAGFPRYYIHKDEKVIVVQEVERARLGTRGGAW